jgi:hypothetical protein
MHGGCIPAVQALEDRFPQKRNRTKLNEASLAGQRLPVEFGRR